MNDRKFDFSHWLNSEMQTQVQQVFLHEFKKILSSKSEMSSAIFDRQSLRLNTKPMGLTDFDKLKFGGPKVVRENKEEQQVNEVHEANLLQVYRTSAFLVNGELDELGLKAAGVNYKADVDRVTTASLIKNGFNVQDGELCYRERLIIDAARSSATAIATQRFDQAFLILSSKQAEISELIFSASKNKKKQLNTQNCRYETEMFTVKEFVEQSISLVCFRIKSLGLKYPLADEIKTEMKQSIEGLLAELAWKSLYNRVLKIKLMYKKVELSRELSMGIYEQATHELATYIETLNQGELSNLNKLTNLAVVLKEAFDQQAKDPKRLFSNKKVYASYADFVDNLNKKQNKNHFARMLGLVLKNLFTDPTIPRVALPIDADISSFKTALNDLAFPVKHKHADFYHTLLPIEIELIGSEPQQVVEKENNEKTISTLFRFAKNA